MTPRAILKFWRAHAPRVRSPIQQIRKPCLTLPAGCQPAVLSRKNE